MNKDIKRALITLAHLFNHHHISWSLGGSLLLFLNDISCQVNDIDILVQEKDLELLKTIIKDFPVIKVKEKSMYKTTFFQCIEVHGIHCDIMVGFQIEQINACSNYIFDDQRDLKEITIEGEKIILSSLAEWERAYRVMKRPEKVLLIQKKKSENF